MGPDKSLSDPNPGVPGSATVLNKSDSKSIPKCMDILESIFWGKGCQMGSQGKPKILENLQKSSKILPKVPSGEVLYADPKKSSNNFQKLMILGRADMQSVHACAVQTHFSVFLLFLRKGTQKISQMLPFGHFWGPLGTQMRRNSVF